MKNETHVTDEPLIRVGLRLYTQKEFDTAVSETEKYLRKICDAEGIDAEELIEDQRQNSIKSRKKSLMTTTLGIITKKDYELYLKCGELPRDCMWEINT